MAEKKTPLQEFDEQLEALKKLKVYKKDEEKFADLIIDLRGQYKRMETLENDLDELDGEKNDLQSELDERADISTNVYQALTDRSNWDGNTWKPVLRSMEQDPIDFIERGRAPLH